jgi:hypothetical protein
LYARLTDAQGKYAFKVDVIHLENDQMLAHFETGAIQVGANVGTIEGGDREHSD